MGIDNIFMGHMSVNTPVGDGGLVQLEMMVMMVTGVMGALV